MFARTYAASDPAVQKRSAVSGSRQNSPVNPLESALPRFPNMQFVTPIESTRKTPVLQSCIKSAVVTQAFTALTETPPRNPSRMNTSEKCTKAHTIQSPLNIVLTIRYAICVPLHLLRNAFLNARIGNNPHDR